MKEGYLAARCCPSVWVLSTSAEPCLLHSLYFFAILDGIGGWYGLEVVPLLVKFVSY